MNFHINLSFRVSTFILMCENRAFISYRKCILLTKSSQITFVLKDAESFIFIFLKQCMICTRNHLSRVITHNQDTVTMTSTAVSKRVFQSQTAL